MNIVIDTNVLISALKSKQGASYKLLISLPDNLFVPNVSVPLFIEYESVAKKTGLLSNLNSEEIDSILDYFLSKSSVREIFYLWRPYLKDPKDDLVLEVAVESKSKYIVTFNKRDFKGCDKFGIQAVTPQEFMTIRGI
ncbi:MAG: putative toxin-antitoxin system toxin component, PIN family [Thiotrichaceae bacterium]|nr:putative toxin-antitoxin system toxin component, PIN family [Thiotrichaceae bacterium]